MQGVETWGDGQELGLPLLRGLADHDYTDRQLVAIDMVVVALFVVISVVFPPLLTSRVSGDAWSAFQWSAGITTSVVILCRHRFPRATLAYVLPLSAITFATGVVRLEGVYVVMAVYSVVVVLPRSQALVVMTAASTVALVAAIIGSGDVLAAVGVAASIDVAGLAAENVRIRRDDAAQRSERLAELAAAADAEHAAQVRRAVAEERAEIARELHDVVAHAMSVIAVRAGVARMLIDSQPEQAREALSIIETTTRRSLQEMRLLVGVLRDSDNPQAELGPAPGLDDLDRLISDTQAAGVAVEVSIVGEPRGLQPAADLSAYRIIQEALTNVVRHAGPTRAHVVIAYRRDEIDIEVRDRGTQQRGSADAARAPIPPTGHARGGHGLIGMRERAALFGGAFDAGPDDHGFRVHARLNTGDDFPLLIETPDPPHAATGAARAVGSP